MPSGGLVALIDDIAALSKLAAASLDDVAGAASRAGAKAAGVVIDDTAVTPRYVMGLSPDRELPIILKIARGSLFNKLIILLPILLLLAAFAPWMVTPILMAGGTFLSFEGVEKLIEKLTPGHGAEKQVEAINDPVELEKRQVTGAVRTDLILSAEIMAIALGEISHEGIWTEATVLVLVALALTIGVYGVVALIVKMDDIGLALSRRQAPMVRTIGRGLVKAMPRLLDALSWIGMVAMLWVGGGIFLHGLHEFHLTPLPGWVDAAAETAAHAVPVASGTVHWLVEALCGMVIGTAIGAILVGLTHLLRGGKGH